MPDFYFFLLLRFFLAGFAAYRLARLVTVDKITDGLRSWLGRKAAGKPKYHPRWLLAEVAGCPYCLGLWISLALAFWFHPVTPGQYLMFAFGIAGFQAFLEMHS